MTDTTEAGAEAGNESFLASIEAEQAAAEAQQPVSAEDAGEADPGETGEAQDDGKAALPPLSVEEYQKRHQDITTALKHERGEKRQMRSELNELRATVQQMQANQPQAFQQFSLEQQINQYQTIDWQRWGSEDPEQAQASWNHYQQLLSQRGNIQQQQQQAQQTAQQQQQAQAFNALVTTLNDQETAIRLVKPDYDKAVEFLKADLIKEANGQGWFGPAAEQYATNQLVQIGARVDAAGQDMAEFGYSMAVQRGYKATADIASIKAGEAAAKTISTMGAKASNAGGSFEETMGNLTGAAARSFWEKTKAARA